MLEVYIDGSCEPVNPGGTASYGLLVIRDGQTIFAEGRIIGSGERMSNNVAEYESLLAFLRWWDKQEPAQVKSDSQLLVKQMRGEWAAHGGLYLAYYYEAKRQCAFSPITFLWIPREQNAKADGLSIKALAEVGIIPVRRKG